MTHYTLQIKKTEVHCLTAMLVSGSRCEEITKRSDCDLLVLSNHLTNLLTVHRLVKTSITAFLVAVLVDAALRGVVHVWLPRLSLR